MRLSYLTFSDGLRRYSVEREREESRRVTEYLYRQRALSESTGQVPAQRDEAVCPAARRRCPCALPAK